MSPLFVTLLIALAGLVIFGLAKDGHFREAGKIMFAVGLAVYLLCICHATKFL